LIAGTIIGVALFAIISIILVLLKKDKNTRESARVFLEDFNNNTYLALSKMKVSCKQNEFLISFTLKQDKGIFFYEFSCIEHNFDYLISLNSNFFPNITNQTFIIKEISASNNFKNSSNLNKTSNWKNNYYNTNSTTNPLNNNTYINTSYNNATQKPESEEPFNFPESFPNQTFGSDNKSLNETRPNGSISDLMEEEVEEEELISNLNSSISCKSPPLGKLNQNKTLNNLNPLFNYSLPIIPKVSFCDSNVDSTLGCITREVQDNSYDDFESKHTNETKSNITYNPLFLQAVWYQTQSVFVSKENLKEVYNLQLLEIFCEKNFGLAEFFLVFDEIGSSFSYKYRCVGSRVKYLMLKCRKKLSNFNDFLAGLDNLVNIKVEAGKDLQLISNFKFNQRNSDKLANYYAYSICNIYIPLMKKN
jgi:hypothetical protein